MNHIQDESDAIVPRILSPWQPPIVQRHDADVGASPDSPASAGGLNAALIWHTWRRWWHACLPAGALLASLAVLGVWATFRPVYRAEAWLKIESSAPFLVSQSAAGGVSMGSQDVFVRTQLQLIRSPVVIEPVLERAPIAAIPEIRAMSNPVATLGKTISVESDNDSELYQVTYAAGSPTDAANLVNAVLEEYTKSYDDEGVERRKTIIENLEEVAKSHYTILTGLRANVQALAKKLTGEEVIGASDNAAVVFGNPQELAALLSDLGSSEVDRAVLTAELQAMQKSQTEHRYEPPEVLVQGAIEQHEEVLRARAVAAQERQLFDDSAAASTRGANDPLLARLRKRVADAEVLVRTTEDKVRQDAIKMLSTRAAIQGQVSFDENVAALQARIRTHETREVLLKERIAKIRQSHQGSGETAVMLEFAKGDLSREAGVFETLQNRINELTTENRAPSRVEVLRKARAPSSPTEILPWKKFGMGVLGGLLAPLALALLWEFKTQRISAGEELSSAGQAPLFGEITALPSRPRLATSRAEQGFIVQRAAFEDSVHYLCRSMLLAAGDDLHVVALTSAVSGEGKTSLSAQLSISLAQCTHAPVILVDADVRDPDMHEIYGLPLSPGLVEVMLGQCSLSEAIHPTAAKNVYLLPAGRANAHPHILLHQDRLRELLDELRKEYRYVVLDTPPVLAVGESLSVCKLADGVLICALRDVTKQSQVQVLQQRLRMAGAKTLGVVLSGVSPRTYASKYGEYAFRQKNA
ncbi:MAG: polysaccharide biosynthesis tyrosine autokinase [Planctomycetia bacterium]|mgnify:CR=1 FL=1|nr:polysaccharide biosynthesis tyrosine autokinase [Planctomycetia bacterium]